ncbi:MAG: hypothetical protein HUU35_06945 [Armatimonadetes bacterium]|nr:hypothetical protein [Armatimonadota bacterium]
MADDEDSRLLDSAPILPELVEPIFREPVMPPEVYYEIYEPYIAPPPDPYEALPPSEPVPDPYVEAPYYSDPYTEPYPDPYVEAPSEPQPDPYVEAPGAPYPDPYVEAPGAPYPDPYVEAPSAPYPDPYVEAPGAPYPDPYVEAPSEPAYDPYAWWEPSLPVYVEEVYAPYTEVYEYFSVFPLDGSDSHPVANDSDRNGTFEFWGPRPADDKMQFEYQRGVQPRGLGAQGVHAVRRAMKAWNEVAGRQALSVSYQRNGTRGAVRDGVNVVTWREFTGKGRDLPAAVFIWDNGDAIVEADIVLNVRFGFAANRPIRAGDRRRGMARRFDLQAVVTHELGHALGLRDLDAGSGSEDSTMYYRLQMGDVRKQTLTEGERRGLREGLRRKSNGPRHGNGNHQGHGNGPRHGGLRDRLGGNRR